MPDADLNAVAHTHSAHKPRQAHTNTEHDTDLGGVDDLVGERLGDGLDVAEGRLARARRDQVDGLGGDGDWIALER